METGSENCLGGRKVMKSNYHPPRWAVRFFRFFCNDHLAEAVLGDLLELYARRCRRLGRRRADMLFIWNVVQFIQPFAIRGKSSTMKLNAMDMLANYLKVAWRNMSRQKMYTSIKVGGFALGLATCIVITLFIVQELSFEAHVKDADRVYRVYASHDGPEYQSGTAFPAHFASILLEEYPEIEKAARLIPYKWFNAGSNLMRPDGQTENNFEEGFAYADPALLEILDVPMIYGSREHCLANPNTIVISKSKAQKYFGNENPVGRAIILNDDRNQPFVIGGVMNDFPSTSHLQFNFFITLAGKEFWPGEQTSWCCWNYNPYIKVKPGTDAQELERKMLGVKKIYRDFLIKEQNQSVEEMDKNLSFRLQPLSDIHLFSSRIEDVLPHGDIRYVWLFGAIACFILTLACINFVNLSTARSANRAKEVGLRKVVGSHRSYLVKQFLSESILYSLVSFMIALVLVSLALPFFNELAGKSLSVPWQSSWFLPLMAASALVIGVIAGVYPSFYLSAFKPVDVLKGSIARGSKASTMRSAMVVFQFTTSIVLIIGTFIIDRQMDFILNKKLGFDKDQVIMLHGANTLAGQQQSFKDELLQISGVSAVTISNYYPVEGTTRDQNMFWRDGKSQEEKGIGAQRWIVDEDYLPAMGMKLVEGRNFNRALASDSQAVIINQAMARALGLNKPLGDRIMNWESYMVIGVVEDFHWENMKGQIRPLCFTLGSGGDIVSIKVASANMAALLVSVQALWKRFMPHQPIRYTFLDENYKRMYEDVQRMGRVFATFAVLAIIVACLGLFALSAFMVEQRNKEIGIRLALGASLNSIFRLLTGNFIKLVMVSFIVAVPLSAYLMSTWLQDYEYRTEITWDVFVMAGFLTVFIALLTVSYQSIRAALINPAETLRSE